MPELEDKIAVWRTEMAAALRGNEKAVRELEEHLRDQIEAFCRAGKTPDEAFGLAVEKLGEAREIAGEFSNLRSSWIPESWTIRAILGLWLLLIGTYFMWFLEGADAFYAKRGFVVVKAADPLLMFGSFVIGICYLAVLATALIGISALLRGWRRPLVGREALEFRTQMGRLIFVSGYLVSAGTLIGFVLWWKKQGGSYEWTANEMGMLIGSALTMLLWATHAGLLTRPVWRLLPILGSVFMAIRWL